MLTMKKSDPYPHLSLMIRILAQDSDIKLKPTNKWVWPENVLDLEEQASRLEYDEDKATFVVGEMAEGQALSRKYKLTDLWEFCCEIFEGSLRTNFYKD